VQHQEHHADEFTVRRRFGSKDRVPAEMFLSIDRGDFGSDKPASTGQARASTQDVSYGDAQLRDECEIIIVEEEEERQEIQ
jgi:hypothetical protein